MQLAPTVNKQFRFLSATMLETEHQKYDAEVDEEPDMKVKNPRASEGCLSCPWGG